MVFAYHALELGVMSVAFIYKCLVPLNHSSHASANKPSCVSATLPGLRSEKVAVTRDQSE